MASIDIIMILDASGSMYDLRGDTVGAFNKFIADQRKQPGEAYVTLATFDNTFAQRYQAKPLHDVPPLDEDGYMGGHGNSTALLDAVGKEIVQYESLPIKADKTMFVIDTDGFENASREWTLERVRALIEKHKADGWAFVFLGANDSAWQGESYGASRVGRTVGSAAGVRAKYGTVSRNVSATRSYLANAREATETMDWNSGEA
jgi:hypothetical protein